MKLNLFKVLFDKDSLESSCKGRIEYICPSYVSGWLYSENTKFEELRFMLGDNLIAKTHFNIYRKDVCDFLNVEGCFGFLLIFEDVLPSIFIDFKPRFIANTVDCSKTFDLNSIEKEINIDDIWKSIMKNNLIGCDGYFDGFVNEKYIQGWAGRKRSKEKLKIWLQCSNQTPISLTCNMKRMNLENKDIHSNAGFLYEIDNLPIEWFGNQIWCSFDKEGICKLPQKDKVILKKRVTEAAVFKGNDVDVKEEENKSFDDINMHAQYLDKVKTLLEIIDTQMFTEKNNKKNFVIDKIYKIQKYLRKN